MLVSVLVLVLVLVLVCVWQMHCTMTFQTLTTQATLPPIHLPICLPSNYLPFYWPFYPYVFLFHACYPFILSTPPFLLPFLLSFLHFLSVPSSLHSTPFCLYSCSKIFITRYIFLPPSLIQYRILNLVRSVHMYFIVIN